MLSSGDLGSSSQREKSKGFLTCLQAVKMSRDFACVIIICPRLPWATAFGGWGPGHTVHTHEKVQLLVSGIMLPANLLCLLVSVPHRRGKSKD